MKIFSQASENVYLYMYLAIYIYIYIYIYISRYWDHGHPNKTPARARLFCPKRLRFESSADCPAMLPLPATNDQLCSC